MSKKFYTKGEVMAILNIGQENIDNVLNEYIILVKPFNMLPVNT